MHVAGFVAEFADRLVIALASHGNAPVCSLAAPTLIKTRPRFNVCAQRPHRIIEKAQQSFVVVVECRKLVVPPRDQHQFRIGRGDGVEDPPASPSGTVWSCSP